MANEITTGDDVLVEFAENNILSVDPNKVYENGEAQPRLVPPENLTIYANLKARVIPRSKLIAGVGVDSETTESFVDVFEGKINFLKPGDKDYMTTDWTDTQTGKGMGRDGGIFNQKYIKIIKDPLSGIDNKVESIRNKLDSESFGIENITVAINRGFVPQVTITFVDVRGQTLFEQGQNSPYAAFFQLPYPLFKLILKGFYGKAVQYQLMLQNFTASFDGTTGNYIVTCTFKGRVAALLADITLQELRTAPYMFSKSYQVSNEGTDTTETFITSKGRQILQNVYKSYKSLGIVNANLPEYTLDELIKKLKNLESDIENSLKKEELGGLDDIQIYDDNVDIYRKKILGTAGWKDTYMEIKENENTHPYTDPITQEKYYRWKQFYGDDEQKKEDAKQKLKEIIDTYNKELTTNPTFGNRGKEAIPVSIKYENFIARRPEGFNQYTDNWFVFDISGESFGVKIGEIFSIFNTKRNKIEQELTNNVNSIVIASLGFKPTVRNLLAIVIAQADTFLRLIDDTHTKAFNVRDNPHRVNAINGDGKSSLSSEFTEENFVYPWPHYYVRKEEKAGASFISTYPGDVNVIENTKAYDPVLWPEVDFVEEFLRAQVLKDADTLPKFDTSIAGEAWIPISSFDLFENTLYGDTAYTSFLYEIWDRMIVHTLFSGIATRLPETEVKSVMVGLSELETFNIKEKTNGFFDIQEFLKNNTFNYNTFLTYLRDIAPLTDFQLISRDEYATPYIRKKINGGRFSLYPSEEFLHIKYYSDEGDIQSAINKMEDVIPSSLNPSKSNEDPNLFDTYPLIVKVDSDSSDFSLAWSTVNLAYGRQINSLENFNEIVKSIRVGPDQKMYTSYIEGDEEISVPLINSTYPTFYSGIIWALINAQDLYSDFLTARTTEVVEDTNLKFKSLYNERVTPTTGTVKKLFLTEGIVNYGNTYSGNTVPTQITSILNTPYFINSIVEGTEAEINDNPYPYVAGGYLLLNSLPLATLREKTIIGPKSDEGDNYVYGNYICKTLNQLSAVHPLPYAWILKYGSIWHRYKTFIKNGTDILSGVWTDMDANALFNADNGLTKQYNLDVGPNGSAITFGGQWNIGGNFTKMNLGFYPELNNYISYFVTGNLLYNGTNITGIPLTSAEINVLLDTNTIVLNEAKELLIDSTPSTNAPQDMNCSFWYAYYDMTRDSYLSGFTTPQYFLLPSFGGLKNEQLQFEVKNPVELLNNPSAHNGSTRLAWGMSNYGFFQHTADSIPRPNQYFKTINPSTEYQNPFEITPTPELYSSIEELFDVFTPDILDVFETYFLNFCKKDTNFDSNLPAFTSDTQSLEVTSPKTFQGIMRNILTIDQSDVELTTSGSTQWSFNLGKAQLKKINVVLTNFLKQQVAFNFYNPTDMNPRAFRTFVGDASYMDFGKYQANLPPNMSLFNSQNSYSEEWQTLKLEVGFYGPALSGSSSPSGYYYSFLSGSTLLSDSDSGSLVTDFFRDMDIAFTSENIKQLRKIIRIYVTERIKDGALLTGEKASFTATEFKQKIKTQILDRQDTAQFSFVEELFLQLSQALPMVSETQAEDYEKKSSYKTEENKLEQYMVFKVLNDKWISGENFNDKLLFKDFLFFDIANRDIGDRAILSTDIIKSFDNPNNATMSLYNVIGAMLQGNFFNFLAMPSYINFYGMTSNGNQEIPKFSTQDEANAVFGTHLEVDYLDSSPKFLCQYIGEPSTQLADLGPQTKYSSDSFILGRTADNPLFSDCYNPATCNKVVSFAVDFGIQNQAIFKGISLDQSEFKNTSESMAITEMMAQSANNSNISTQGLSLFNIYKSRSYTCKIEAMGNVCIQPTMYFTLRHVPMFNGPYIILNVEHQITSNQMITSFTGVRVPFHRLPDIDNLVGKVNKSFVTKLRKQLKSDEVRAVKGGFSAENQTEKDNNNGHASPFTTNDTINKLIVHVTGSLDYNTVESLNTKAKEDGFAGIPYHYLITREGKLLGGRPLIYIGAHTRHANNNSLGIVLVAGCDKMGTYESNAGELPNSAQKTKLENTLLYLLFINGIFKLKKNSDETQLNLSVRGINGVILDPTQITDAQMGVTSKVWHTVIKGHNDYNKQLRCPCFRMEAALNLTGNVGGDLGKNLRKKLSDKIKANEANWLTLVSDEKINEAAIITFFTSIKNTIYTTNASGDIVEPT